MKDVWMNNKGVILLMQQLCTYYIVLTYIFIIYHRLIEGKSNLKG